MLKLIAAATVLLTAAPAMAQYTAVPYGQGTMLLPPSSGASGYSNSPPPAPTFFIPNAQLTQPAPQQNWQQFAPTSQNWRQFAPGYNP